MSLRKWKIMHNTLQPPYCMVRAIGSINVVVRLIVYDDERVTHSSYQSECGGKLRGRITYYQSKNYTNLINKHQGYIKESVQHTQQQCKHLFLDLTSQLCLQWGVNMISYKAMYTVCQWCTCSVVSWPITTQLWYQYKLFQPHADVKSRKRYLYCYCVCCTLSLMYS